MGYALKHSSQPVSEVYLHCQRWHKLHAVSSLAEIDHGTSLVRDDPIGFMWNRS
jgi:hypothetical protein